MLKVNAGDIGKEKERREMIPIPEPSEAPLQEPSPEIEPAEAPVPLAEPVPA